MLRTLLEFAREDEQRPWILRVGGGLLALVAIAVMLHALLLPELLQL